MLRKRAKRWLATGAVLTALVAVGMVALTEDSVSAGTAAPANDNFADAIIISEPLPYGNKQDTSGATLETGEPEVCSGIASTVWYSFTPGSNVLLVADTDGSSYDTALAAYTGADLNALTAVDCDSDSGPGSSSLLTINAFVGETYFFQVGGDFGESGNQVFNLNFIPPPLKGNDDFEDAIVISGPLPFTNKDDTTGATHEMDEPLSCVPGSTVWYSYTPSVDSVLLAHAVDDVQSGRLRVYTGATLASLTSETDCYLQGPDPSSPNPPVAFVAFAGIKYYFQAGAGAANLTLILDGSPCLAGGCPEMLLNVPGGDCDDPDRPTVCNISVGKKFTLAVEIPAAPPQEYILAQTYIEFGSTLQYKPDPPKTQPAAQFTTNEIKWPDCDPGAALRSVITPTNVLHGCISGIPVPQPSDYAGTFVALSFTCSEAPSSTVIVLLPEGVPVVGATSGALFVLSNTSTLRPEQRTLTVNCVDAAPAPVGGVALDAELRGIAGQDRNAPWLWATLGLGGAIVAMSALTIVRRHAASR